MCGGVFAVTERHWHAEDTLYNHAGAWPVRVLTGVWTYVTTTGLQAEVVCEELLLVTGKLESGV